MAAVRDYQNNTITNAQGRSQPLEGPLGNLVILDLAEEGNYVAVRPSGTEPKVKFYMFTFVPAEQLADLDSARSDMERRLDQFTADLRQVADSV